MSQPICSDSDHPAVCRRLPQWCRADGDVRLCVGADGAPVPDIDGQVGVVVGRLAHAEVLQRREEPVDEGLAEDPNPDVTAGEAQKELPSLITSGAPGAFPAGLESRRYRLGRRRLSAHLFDVGHRLLVAGWTR